LISVYTSPLIKVIEWYQNRFIDFFCKSEPDLTNAVVYVDAKVKGQFNLKSKARTKSTSARRYSIKANQFIGKPYRDLLVDYFQIARPIGFHILSLQHVTRYLIFRMDKTREFDLLDNLIKNLQSRTLSL